MIQNENRNEMLNEIEVRKSLASVLFSVVKNIGNNNEDVDDGRRAFDRNFIAMDLLDMLSSTVRKER